MVLIFKDLDLLNLYGSFMVSLASRTKPRHIEDKRYATRPEYLKRRRFNLDAALQVVVFGGVVGGDGDGDGDGGDVAIGFRDAVLRFGNAWKCVSQHPEKNRILQTRGNEKIC